MRRVHITSRQVILICVVAVLFLFSWIVWRHLQPTPLATIPNEVSQDLLFTPYVPSSLPKEYTLQPSSFSYKDGALFFFANKNSSTTDVLSVSEQAVPKNFDINNFYETTLENPTRLQGTPHAVIFGKRIGSSKSTVIGVTTSDSTWILITATSGLGKNDIKQIVTGLVPR